MDYEWDSNKAKSNFKKYGVRFADSVSVFEDPYAATIKTYEEGEERQVTLGMDYFARILVVVYTYPPNSKTRIISARKASKNEKKNYKGLMI